MMMPFQGIQTFLKTPFADETKPIGFLGLPYDCSVTFRNGARLAPAAVRKMSLMLTDGDHFELRIDPAKYVSDFGDAALMSVAPRQALLDIETAVDEHSHRHMMFCGGDHLITLGILRSLYKVHGRMSLIMFDAHPDMWETAFGETYGHGTFLFNAISEGLIDPGSSIMAGIRGPVDQKTRKAFTELGGLMLSARHASNMGVAELTKTISERVGGRKAYLTFDIDCMDPGCIGNATGTPEIGGFQSIFMMEVLESLQNEYLIGMDVVELSPPYDASETGALFAATVFHTYAAMISKNNF